MAVVAVATGAAGHLVAGGAVAALGIVGATAGMAAGAWALTRRERHWKDIAALLLAGQLLTHVLLQLASLLLLDPAAVHQAADAAHAGHWWPSPMMLLAHALAAGVTAGWLRWGERLVWAAARRTACAAAAAVTALRGLLSTNPGGGPVAPLGLIDATWLRPAQPQPQRLRHSVVLRAPPAAE